MPLPLPDCPWCGAGVGNTHFARDCPYVEGRRPMSEQEIEWCETHGSLVPAGESCCEKVLFDSWLYDCSVVPAVLTVLRKVEA